MIKLTKKQALVLWRESDRTWYTYTIDLWLAKWITDDDLMRW